MSRFETTSAHSSVAVTTSQIAYILERLKMCIMDKVFLYLFTILVLAMSVPAQAITCGEFNGLGPSAKNLQALIAPPASHAQVDVYRKIIADHAASIAFQTITARARALQKLRNSKEGLVPLVRESLALTRAAPHFYVRDQYVRIHYER